MSIEVKEGEFWYLKKDPRDKALTKAEVLDVTERTILIRDMRTTYNEVNRYKISDLELVEQENLDG